MDPGAVGDSELKPLESLEISDLQKTGASL